MRAFFEIQFSAVVSISTKRSQQTWLQVTHWTWFRCCFVMFHLWIDNGNIPAMNPFLLFFQFLIQFSIFHLLVQILEHNCPKLFPISMIFVFVGISNRSTFHLTHSQFNWVRYSYSASRNTSLLFWFCFIGWCCESQNIQDVSSVNRTTESLQSINWCCVLRCQFESVLRIPWLWLLRKTLHFFIFDCFFTRNYRQQK